MSYLFMLDALIYLAFPLCVTVHLSSKKIALKGIFVHSSYTPINNNLKTFRLRFQLIAEHLLKIRLSLRCANSFN